MLVAFLYWLYPRLNFRLLSFQCKLLLFIYPSLLHTGESFSTLLWQNIFDQNNKNTTRWITENIVGVKYFTCFTKVISNSFALRSRKLIRRLHVWCSEILYLWQNVVMYIPISVADRKYSSRFWLEFSMPFIPLIAFNTHLSCFIPWFVPIEVNRDSDFATKKLLPSSYYMFLQHFFLVQIYARNRQPSSVNNSSRRMRRNKGIIVTDYTNGILTITFWWLGRITGLLWRASYKCNKIAWSFKDLLNASSKAVNLMDRIPCSR